MGALQVVLLPCDDTAKIRNHSCIHRISELYGIFFRVRQNIHIFPRVILFNVLVYKSEQMQSFSVNCRYENEQI